MRHTILLFAILLLSVSNINAQNVTINEEPIISKMMVVYAGKGKPVANTPAPTGGSTAYQMIDGFRVQLVASNDRRKAEEIQATFSARYPGVHVGIVQQAPYYKVRVGGFANRSDAMSYLQKIKISHPDAYVVPDRVKTTEMTGN
jgi:cell division septation protein DedD